MALLSGSIAYQQGPCSQRPRKPLSARWILKDKYNKGAQQCKPSCVKFALSLFSSLHALQSTHMTQMRDLTQFNPNIRSLKCSTFLILDLYLHSSSHQYLFPFQLGLLYISTCPYTPSLLCITQLPSILTLGSICIPVFRTRQQLEGLDAKGEFSTVKARQAFSRRIVVPRIRLRLNTLLEPLFRNANQCVGAGD